MNNKILILVLFLLFCASYLLGQWLGSSDDRSGQRPRQSMTYQSCDPTSNPCKVYIEDHELVFAFLQQVSALKPFTTQLKTGDLQPESVSVEFTMPGMDMGINRYRLQLVGPGQWQARVTLPICSLGRSDWMTQLRINYQGKTWLAEFAFEQSGRQ